MSTADDYYRKMSAINKDFQCWMPLHSSQESQLVCEKMSAADNYYRKLSALNKDFQCWLPLQTSQEDESTRLDEMSDTRVSSPATGHYRDEITRLDEVETRLSRVYAGHHPKKDARTGSIPTDRKCWSTKSFCNFCRQNGHQRDYYEAHRLRDSSGRLECPILRGHVCEVCGATGDEAHTISYCPVLKAAGIAPPKTALLLKNTLYDSCGRRRRP